jgi:hypothetical protein
MRVHAVCFVVVSLACKQADPTPAPSSATATVTPTATPPNATAATPSAATSTEANAGSSGDYCAMQPYARRCDPGCKAAHKTALSTTCGTETNAFLGAVPNQVEMGKCLVKCRGAGEDTTCVGAQTKAECECKLACYKALPGDAVAKAKTAGACYDKAVASACN